MREIDLIYEKQKEYSYIKSIDIFRDIEGDECSKFNVKLSLVKFPCWDEGDCFEVVFERVSNLKIGDIDNLLSVLMQIESIAEYQRESEKYIVKECENELFSFACSKIVVC